jgi:hypothetical protein
MRILFVIVYAGLAFEVLVKLFGYAKRLGILKAQPLQAQEGMGALVATAAVIGLACGFGAGALLDAEAGLLADAVGMAIFACVLAAYWLSNRKWQK